MNDDLIGLAVVFSTLAVMLPLALSHGTFKAREIQDAWRKLAERNRLAFDGGNWFRGAKVTGSLVGRSFLLKKSGSGNQAFHMELGLRGPLPAGLRMKPRGRHPRTWVEVVGVPESQIIERTGEVRLNEMMSVKGTDRREIAEYLTPTRKRAALRLAAVGGELDGHTVRVAVTKKAHDLEDLDKALHVLTEAAPLLEGR